MKNHQMSCFDVHTSGAPCMSIGELNKNGTSSGLPAGLLERSATRTLCWLAAEEDEREGRCIQLRYTLRPTDRGRKERRKGRWGECAHTVSVSASGGERVSGEGAIMRCTQ